MKNWFCFDISKSCLTLKKSFLTSLSDIKGKEMPFVCSVCGKKFDSCYPKDADVHLTSHTGQYAKRIYVSNHVEMYYG